MPSNIRGACRNDAQKTGRLAEIIPIEPVRVMRRREKKCIFSKNSPPLLFLLKFRLSKRKRMKSVLIIASTLMALSAEGKNDRTGRFSENLKRHLAGRSGRHRNQSSQRDTGCLQRTDKGRAESSERRTRHPLPDPPSPSVIMTSDAGTGIGYSGFRIRGTDANRINITVNGVPVNDSESHTVFWVNMPDFASSVDNIQIQRGAGTSTNGAAASEQPSPCRRRNRS